MVYEGPTDQEPNYDELLKDLDFSPNPHFSRRIDEQLDSLSKKLHSLNLSHDMYVKVMVEAMLRCDAACRKLENRH